VPEGDGITLRRFYELPAGIGPAERFAMAHDGQRHVFFSALPRAEPRGGSDAVRTVPVLFADIDAKDFVRGEAEIEVRLGDLSAIGLGPTAVVRSGGGGRHAYWLLREPVKLNTASAAEQVRSTLWALGAGVGIPARANVACDLARLLRVPETLNIKAKYGTPQLCMVEQLHPERRYDLADFVPLVRSYPRPAAQLGTRRWVSFSPGLTLPADPQDLLRGLDISRPVRELIHAGAEPGRRSETDMKAIVALVRAGASPDRIRAVFAHLALGIGAKYREHPQPDRYLGYSISKAQAWVEAHPPPGQRARASPAREGR
jgi:hypothetical protein